MAGLTFRRRVFDRTALGAGGWRDGRGTWRCGAYSQAVGVRGVAAGCRGRDPRETRLPKPTCTFVTFLTIFSAWVVVSFAPGYSLIYSAELPLHRRALSPTTNRSSVQRGGSARVARGSFTRASSPNTPRMCTPSGPCVVFFAGCRMVQKVCSD